jgi:hypothetical protein
MPFAFYHKISNKKDNIKTLSHKLVCLIQASSFCYFISKFRSIYSKNSKEKIAQCVGGQQRKENDFIVFREVFERQHFFK